MLSANIRQDSQSGTWRLSNVMTMIRQAIAALMSSARCRRSADRNSGIRSGCRLQHMELILSTAKNDRPARPQPQAVPTATATNGNRSTGSLTAGRIISVTWATKTITGPRPQGRRWWRGHATETGSATGPALVPARSGPTVWVPPRPARGQVSPKSDSWPWNNASLSVVSRSPATLNTLVHQQHGRMGWGL